MSDIKLDEEFERYVIGFTENHFIPSGAFSPTPSDHAIGYNTFALGFAEKSNRGESKIFQDHSVHLDRQKRHSVSKIHTSILDLMSELSERRKVATPLLSKSAMELYRPDSTTSNLSDSSFKSSSSLPMIEVQQLPPLMRSASSFPALASGDYGLPDIDGHQNDSINAKKKKNHKNKSKNQRNRYTSSATKQQNSQGPTKLETVVTELIKKNKEKTVSKDKDNADEKKANGKTETNENDSRNVRFKIGDDNLEQGASSQETEHAEKSEQPNKWKIIYEKLRDAMIQVKERGDSFNAYRGRYFSSDSKARKMSFCQSSYKERAERERMQNIRRRHSSQTNVGPIDFNKLRRQLTIGKSKTMYN
jgi:hypothetical protein